MKAFSSAVVLSSAALLLAPAVSYGQAGGVAAYVVGRDGNPIVAARTGECVRTRFWTPAAPACGRAATPTPAAAQGRPMKR
jgi:hypothetical protein